ncbi:hypothetical protein MD535_22155 [Vibrio sp. ZSDZ65]|uniref:Uncharacterized protein n=1 Tax=Vibrio qingdaonensis TaxID=2829491 RepID=A0A9X3HYD7_9VIBR|nr:hypothetical protein [Vibrio qingdaonensis]MCW8348695.1 hypothetical protein [Vibrio qingdaonensis]
MSSTIEECHFIVALTPEQLQGLLHQADTASRHLYCTFMSTTLPKDLLHQVNVSHIASLSFSDGHTLYPSPIDHCA